MSSESLPGRHDPQGQVDGQLPYPGLKPFDADTARVFFGRADEVRHLTARLRSLGERADGGLLAVVGPSGCGKSSLVRVGLLPAVAGDPEWETVAAFEVTSTRTPASYV